MSEEEQGLGGEGRQGFTVLEQQLFLLMHSYHLYFDVWQNYEGSFGFCLFGFCFVLLVCIFFGFCFSLTIYVLLCKVNSLPLVNDLWQTTYSFVCSWFQKSVAIQQAAA